MKKLEGGPRLVFCDACLWHRFKLPDNRQADGDDAFNDKDHPPALHAANMVQSQNAGRQKATKGTGHGRHDNVQRQAESKFSAAVPPRQVVGNAGHQAGFKHSENEADTSALSKVVDEAHGDGSNAETERERREDPAGSEPLAQNVGGDLEDDI